MKIFSLLPYMCSYRGASSVPVSDDPAWEVLDGESTDTSVLAGLSIFQIQGAYKHKHRTEFHNWASLDMISGEIPKETVRCPLAFTTAMDLMGYDMIIRIPRLVPPSLDPDLIDDD